MALVYASTAEGLAQRFRNNDASNDTWTIDPQGWQSLQGWTPAQGRDVVAAAARNTSLRFLDVRVVDQMTEEAVDSFSVVVGQLRGVNRVDVGMDDLADAPVMPETLDRLCAAIAHCPSDVRHLDCSQFVNLGISPGGVLALTRAFPNLEVWAVAEPGTAPDHPAEDYALAVAGAASGGLPSLRRVRLFAMEPDAVVGTLLPTLLSALHAAASVREVDVDIPSSAAHNKGLLRAARFFCACTRSVEAFTVRGGRLWAAEEGMTAMNRIFDVGPIPSFSPTLTRVEFFRCDFRRTDTEKMVKRAAKALQHVKYLRFGLCDFPSAMKVVEGLPRLTKFSCVNRASVDTPYECMSEGRYYASPYGVVANHELEDLCLAVERRGSPLNDIELDLVSAEGESYPAMVRLMGACKGRLVLNVADFSWIVGARLIEGTRRLRRDLNDLRLRFVNCQLENHTYADIFQSFVSNKTLAHLEVGFDANVEHDAIELSLASIQGLIQANGSLQTLSLLGLRPDGATAILERIMPALTATNASLRALNLHGAAGLSECLPRARTLAIDMLKENYALSTLVVGGETPGGDPVDAVLRQNRYGRIFLRANDPTPIGIWSTVLGRISHDGEVGIMYKFLRAKPGLVRQQPPPSGPHSPCLHGRKRGRGTEERTR